MLHPHRVEASGGDPVDERHGERTRSGVGVGACRGEHDAAPESTETQYDEVGGDQVRGWGRGDR